MPIHINKDNFRAVSKLELIAREIVQGFITGLHKSPLHGFSVEFAEHRIYNEGESTKNIDWKLYARTEKLFVKRYEEETNLRCQIIIDVSPSMYYPVVKKLDLQEYNKLFFSVYAAAAIIEVLRKQRDAYGISLVSDSIEFFSQIKSGELHAHNLYMELEKLIQKPHKNRISTTNLANTITEIANKVHKRSLIVIFSDMFNREENPEELFSALRYLKHNKNEVLLFHVLDKDTEIEFNFENRPYKFIDLETNEEIKLKSLDFKDDYNKEVNRYFAMLKEKCQQYRIDFITADIKQGFVPVLQDYLLKRKRMQ
jgi:uncharacterized protein (DUF58 family)